MADPILIQITVADTAGKQESVEYFANPAATLVELQTEITGIAPLLDAVTGSVLLSASARFPLTLPGGIKTDPTATYLNTRGALIAYDVTGSKYRCSHRLPAVLQAFIEGDDVVIGIAGAMFDYTDWLVTLSDILHTNRYNENLSEVIGASLSLHKRQR